MNFNWIYTVAGTLVAIWIVWVSSTISPLESRVSELIKGQETITQIRNSYVNEKIARLESELEQLKRSDERIFERLARCCRDAGKD